VDLWAGYRVAAVTVTSRRALLHLLSAISPPLRTACVEMQRASVDAEPWWINRLNKPSLLIRTDCVPSVSRTVAKPCRLR